MSDSDSDFEGVECRREFKSGESFYSCLQCRENQKKILCGTCFVNSAHVNHNVEIRQGSGFCDCGISEAWKRNPTCNKHLRKDDSVLEAYNVNLQASSKFVDMEESKCIVCFSQYDDEDHRARVMPCGHTMCSKCLTRAIREDSKRCPRCRKPYSASNVEELPVNFSLEGLVKSCCENVQTNKLPECPEHKLPVSFRCSAHKAWICQSCQIEDHSSQSCKIITIKEELNNRKSRQIDQSEKVLDRLKDSLKKIEEYDLQIKLKEENKEDVIKHESSREKLHTEFLRKANCLKLIIMIKRVFIKLSRTKKLRMSLYQALISLQLSRTFKEVSTYSARVQNESDRLSLIADDIDNDIDLVSVLILKI